MRVCRVHTSVKLRSQNLAVLNKLAIVTRSTNDELFSRCTESLALPFPHIKLRGLGADDYFHALPSLNAEWVINLDEDAFVWDTKALLGLVSYMEENNYAICGMPDGGVVQIRRRNPVAPNAFFNIINLKAVRSFFNLNEIWEHAFGEDLKALTPRELMHGTPFNFYEYEPYYRFFFWAYRKGLRMLYLDAYEWDGDRTSTILQDQTGTPFLIHAWYARDFERQRDRYGSVLALCQEMKIRVRQ